MSYCEYCKSPKAKQVHIDYHDEVYGFPVEQDNELFGRLTLEIYQAGLSWEIILNKKKYFALAFNGWNVSRIANYDNADLDKLRNDASIIRNRRKSEATIHNAKEVLQIQAEFGSFKSWLDQNHPKSKEEWVVLFKTRFKFVGGKILNEFLRGTGYLPGAHDKNCPVFEKISKFNPKWTEI